MRSTRSCNGFNGFLVKVAVCLWMCCCGWGGLLEERDGEDYVAAVAQHTPMIKGGSAKQIIADNLQKYVWFIEQASWPNVSADIIVFPEAGLGWGVAEINDTRDSMLPFLESIPDVINGSPRIIPCGNASFDDRPQLQTLSCMAQKGGMIVVANMGEVIWCNSTSSNVSILAECPSDGRFQYNTDVAFSVTGALLAKYRKLHLFGGEKVFNIPDFNQPPVYFDSHFNVRFGLFICFDMEFLKPALQLYKMGIRHIPFSTNWFNLNPLIDAVEIQQSWSYIFGSTLLAANVGGSGWVSGGGIFQCGQVIDAFFDETKVNVEHLVVSRINKQQKCNRQPSFFIPEKTFPFSEKTKQIEQTKLQSITQCGVPSFNYYGNCSIFSVDEQKEGYLYVSNNNLDCFAKYSVSASNISSSLPGNKTFALFAMNKTVYFHDTPDPFTVEACGIIFCPSPPDCASNTYFYDLNTVEFEALQVTGTFSANTLIFPLLGKQNGSLWNSLDDTVMFDGRQLATKQEVSGMATFMMWGVVQNEEDMK